MQFRVDSWTSRFGSWQLGMRDDFGYDYRRKGRLADRRYNQWRAKPDMFREMCKSKIHRCRVTETCLHYQGSITIDQALMQAADLLPNEKVQVVNLSTGERIDTYAIEGKRRSGTVCLNGAAARCAEPGDEVIIISYCILDDEAARRLKPRIVYVNEHNRIRRPSHRNKK